MVKTVTSSDNKILKLARSLHRKKGREQAGLYFAEGARLVGEAFDSVPDSVRYVLVSESYAADNGGQIKKLDKDGKVVYITRDKLFAEVCDTETPQGIAVLIELPARESADFSDMNYVLIPDGISDPGNMGTIIRTAEAAGIDAVCLSDGCVDVYSPKVVRSSMGSIFRTRFFSADADAVSELKRHGFEVAATALYNSQPIAEAKPCRKRVLIIGSEAHGVSAELLDAADKVFRIDMRGRVESLNAAVAAGIAMYMLRPETEV